MKDGWEGGREIGNIHGEGRRKAEGEGVNRERERETGRHDGRRDGEME